MKKIVILLLVITLCTSVAFAQLTFSGEAKTGVAWEKTEVADKESSENKVTVRMHSYDDAGNAEGRFRLNMDYLNPEGTLGFKLRVQWQNLADKTNQWPDTWPYAFGYGNFYNNQLTVSIGKLGSSPWGTGGPEMWKELEQASTGGIRVEYKPGFPEQYGKLNLGFVLNGPDGTSDAGHTEELVFTDILQESVLGLSYTHDYFMVRVAYRLDSVMDIDNLGGTVDEKLKPGDDFIYRVEERAIQKVLPGFQIWALGFIRGVGSDEPEKFTQYKNWAFIQYAPSNFTAQIRLGWEGSEGRDVLFIKPNFYYKFFEGLIEAGALFGIAQDFGNKIYQDSPYSYWEVQPKMQINFAPNAYAAFEYYYKYEYAFKSDPPFRQTQWMNLRFGIYF